MYISIIFSGSPFVNTLKQQNWLNLFRLNLSLSRILSPLLVYTSSPAPIPFVMSVLSLRKSVSSWYPGIDMVLHHVSVSKIISGHWSTAYTVYSFIFENTLWMLVYIIFNISGSEVGAPPHPRPPSRSSAAVCCCCWPTWSSPPGPVLLYLPVS